MAIPFLPCEEEDGTDDHLLRLVYLLTENIQMLLQLLEQQQVQQVPQPGPQTRTRLPSCEEEDEEDDEDQQDPPSLATVAGVEAAELPDLLPQPAPRAPLAPRAPRWPASSFTKYLTADPRRAAASSDTTLCYALPDLVCDAVGSAPAAPGHTPWACQADPPKPAPRRKRRPQKAATGATCATPSAAPSPASSLHSEWLRRQEDDLEKAISKMAVRFGPGAGPGAGPVLGAAQPPRGCDWVQVGEDLRRIADHFSQNMPVADEVDGPSSSKLSSSSFLSMLLPPPVKGTFLTTVVLMVGWRLLSRGR